MVERIAEYQNDQDIGKKVLLPPQIEKVFSNILKNFKKSVGEDILDRAEENKKEIEERDRKNMEFQKENFITIDRRYLHRNIIVLKHDSESDIYYMKKIGVGDIGNTKWKKITQQQFENPDSLEEDVKFGGIREHVMIVPSKVKDINYIRAKKMLDQKRIKEKRDYKENQPSNPTPKPLKNTEPFPKPNVIDYS